MDWVQALSTIVLVAITGWYAWLTRRMAVSAERSVREANEREVAARRRNDERVVLSRRTTGHAMAAELRALSGYLDDILNDGSTKQPYPRLRLTMLDALVQALASVDNDCIEAVFQVEYQLIACNERAATDGYLRRIPRLNENIELALRHLDRFVAEPHG